MAEDMTAKGPTLPEQIEACELAAVIATRDLHVPIKHPQALTAAAATLRSLAAREQEQSPSPPLQFFCGRCDKYVVPVEGQCPVCRKMVPLIDPCPASDPQSAASARIVGEIDEAIGAQHSVQFLWELLQRARDEIVRMRGQRDLEHSALVDSMAARERIAALEKDLAAARDTIRSMKRQFQIARERP